MNFRVYNPEKDKEAAYQVWREVGWLGGNKEHQKGIDIFLASSITMVADLNERAECVVTSMPAEMRHLDDVLPLAAITGVTTSHIARKQGFARRLTARVIAENVVQQQAAVAGLGIFDQGFYDMLGFGSMPYEHLIRFDPAQLRVNTPFRPPHRITKDDFQAVHDGMRSRMPLHGSVNFITPDYVQAEMIWADNLFALGYKDGPDGALSHFIVGSGSGEHGPYRVWWTIFQTGAQFLELLALLKSLGDQVHLIRMTEPPHVQIQDYLNQPFRFRRITAEGKMAHNNIATSWNQFRICDVAACMAATHLPGPESVRFNLTLSDPISNHLDDQDVAWRGVAGEYIITLGPDSSVTRGSDASLPTLATSVNAFTRMWLGVKAPSRLAWHDGFNAPQSLIANLDRVLAPLPVPHVEWHF